MILIVGPLLVSVHSIDAATSPIGVLKPVLLPVISLAPSMLTTAHFVQSKILSLVVLIKSAGVFILVPHVQHNKVDKALWAFVKYC